MGVRAREKSRMTPRSLAGMTGYIEASKTSQGIKRYFQTYIIHSVSDIPILKYFQTD